MDNFLFSCPTKVYFGEGRAKQAFGAELDKVGKTVMLAYGGGSIKKNGVYIVREPGSLEIFKTILRCRKPIR